MRGVKKVIPGDKQLAESSKIGVKKVIPGE